MKAISVVFFPSESIGQFIGQKETLQEVQGTIRVLSSSFPFDKRKKKLRIAVDMHSDYATGITCFKMYTQSDNGVDHDYRPWCLRRSFRKATKIQCRVEGRKDGGGKERRGRRETLSSSRYVSGDLKSRDLPQP